tara:strand:- start:369 stop:956 length:588 start_codon:yes stop_codon:yes gene_type:complete
MSRTATNQSVVEESMFLRWLANHAGNGLVKIGRAGDTLALKVNMVVARRFAIGDIDSAPFLGIQQPELVAFNEIEWTHIELCPNITPATLTLSSEGLSDADRPSDDQLPVRIIIPAKTKSIKQFGLINKEFLDLRRIVVNDEGRVDRVARLAVKRLPLKVVRAPTQGAGGKQPGEARGKQRAKRPMAKKRSQSRA